MQLYHDVCIEVLLSLQKGSKPMTISTKQQFGSKTSPRAPVIFVLVYVQKINLEWKKILFYEKV